MTNLIFTLVTLMVLSISALAKDPPKKDPHVYIAFALYNQSSTDKDGHTWYALLCRDAKGDKIVVGVSTEMVGHLQELATKPTAISYAGRN